MGYGANEAPALKWETVHVTDDNLIIHLDRNQPALHITVIPSEVIEDATRTSEGPLAALKAAGRDRVAHAVRAAWARGDLRDMWEITGSGLRNIQLWLIREDFD